jgi:hypothetical protein
VTTASGRPRRASCTGSAPASCSRSRWPAQSRPHVFSRSAPSSGCASKTAIFSKKQRGREGTHVAGSRHHCHDPNCVARSFEMEMRPV